MYLQNGLLYDALVCSLPLVCLVIGQLLGLPDLVQKRSFWNPETLMRIDELDLELMAHQSISEQMTFND